MLHNIFNRFVKLSHEKKGKLQYLDYVRQLEGFCAFLLAAM